MTWLVRKAGLRGTCDQLGHVATHQNRSQLEQGVGDLPSAAHRLRLTVAFSRLFPKLTATRSPFRTFCFANPLASALLAVSSCRKVSRRRCE